MATYYAWSDLWNGGETKEVKKPGGVSHNVVSKRNIVKRGEKVTQKNLGVNDEEWEHLVESGSIRAYPVPEGANERISPTRALILDLLDNRGELDMNRLLEMGLANRPVGVEDENAEATAPAGA